MVSNPMRQALENAGYKFGLDFLTLPLSEFPVASQKNLLSGFERSGTKPCAAVYLLAGDKVHAEALDYIKREGGELFIPLRHGDVEAGERQYEIAVGRFLEVLGSGIESALYSRVLAHVLGGVLSVRTLDARKQIIAVAELQGVLVDDVEIALELPRCGSPEEVQELVRRSADKMNNPYKAFMYFNIMLTNRVWDSAVEQSVKEMLIVAFWGSGPTDEVIHDRQYDFAAIWRGMLHMGKEDILRILGKMEVEQPDWAGQLRRFLDLDSE